MGQMNETLEHMEARIGPQGPQGPQGPKGENGDTGSGIRFYEWSHPSGTVGQEFKFRIECSNKCRGLFMQIDSKLGDVDMYGREAGQLPLPGVHLQVPDSQHR